MFINFIINLIFISMFIPFIQSLGENSQNHIPFMSQMGDNSHNLALLTIDHKLTDGFAKSKACVCAFRLIFLI